MHLYDDTQKDYARVTQLGMRMLYRKEYIRIVQHLIRIANSLQLANDDLEVQLEGERERRRKLQEAPDGS